MFRPARAATGPDHGRPSEVGAPRATRPGVRPGPVGAGGASADGGPCAFGLSGSPSINEDEAETAIQQAMQSAYYSGPHGAQ